MRIRNERNENIQEVVASKDFINREIKCFQEEPFRIEKQMDI